MIRVGTDCSGIESPIQALKKIKIPFSHEFSSEIDKFCIESIKANYSPKIMFDDILSRDNSLLPDIDFYICGFPCQPFSMLGNRKGVRDNRGNIFTVCLDVIRTKKPLFFILENVSGLLSIDNGETFKNIISQLESIEKYKIFWKVLNTSDYGLPQNRKRVYIVGTKSEFEWPEKRKMKKLNTFIDYSDDSKDSLPKRAVKSKLLERVPKDSIFVDLSTQGNTNFPKSGEICPCIMKKSDIYCIPMGRRANCTELLALQGFRKDFKKVVSTTQLKGQIGNSMSVDVMEAIIKNLLN